jgi:hypothetical protein
MQILLKTSQKAKPAGQAGRDPYGAACLILSKTGCLGTLFLASLNLFVFWEKTRWLGTGVGRLGLSFH